MRDFFDELHDALEDVQLCDNTAKEAEAAWREIVSILDTFAGKAEASWVKIEKFSTVKQPIKEFCPSELTEGQTHFVVRLSHYGSLLSYFLALFDEAKRDFPELSPEDVKVVHYGGDRYARTFGLEFTLDGVEPPAGYKQISVMEFTR